jgi:SH3 domain protein
MHRWMLFFMISAVSLSLSAETVYINDNLFVGVRTVANSREEPLKVLKTGARLTLLEKGKNFYKIRTEEGIEGWVNSLYVSSEPPAKVKIVALQDEYARVNGELETLRLDKEALLEEQQQLNQQVTTLESENSRVASELREMQETKSSLWTLYRDYIVAGGMLVLFILGILLGMRWHKNYVAKRLGGLEI